MYLYTGTLTRKRPVLKSECASMEAHYPRFMMTGIAEPVIGLTGLNHLTHSQITSIPEEAQS